MPRTTKPPPGTPLDTGNALTAGLVGIWPFNEGSGNPINTVTGTAASSNAMTWATDGTRGTVLSNAGGTNAVSIPITAGSGLDVTGAGVSYGAWINPGNPGGYQTILTRNSGGTRQYAAYLPPSDVNDLFVGSVAANLAGTIPIAPPWVPGAWNHVLVTIAISGGSSTSIVYLNGSRVGALTMGSASNFVSTAGTTLYFGYDPGAAAYPLLGSLDVPHVWNRALSAGDVASFYGNPWQVFLEGPPPPPPSGVPVQPGIEFQFAAAIVSSGLTMTVQNLTTSGFVSGTTTYNSGTRIASWVASPSTPLLRGTKYLVTITGTTAADGTPQTGPITFSFTPGTVGGIRYIPGGGRRIARLTA
jgi:hypothetical protein